MIIGVRAHDFGRSKPDELAQKLKSAGFETCQLALTKAITGINAIGDVTPELLEDVKNAFLKYDVKIGVLGCYVEIGLPEREARQTEVNKFMQGLDYAKTLGVRLVGTETTNYTISSEEGNLSREQTYQNMKNSVMQMLEKAERLNIDVGVETVADHTLYSAEMTRRLLDEANSKRLKIIFDPVNLILTQADIDNQAEIFDSFIDIVGEDISALHVKDIVLEDGKKIWRNIGDGAIKYEPIIKRLRILNPNLPALREHVKPESADVDIEALKRLINA